MICRRRSAVSAAGLALSIAVGAALTLVAPGGASARPQGDLDAGLRDGVSSRSGMVPGVVSGMVSGAVTPVGFDGAAFARALAESGSAAPEPLPGARVVVVPHHWPAGGLIVDALQRAAVPSASGSSQQPSQWRRVILLGPDHHRAGRHAAVTGDRAWLTPFGKVQPDETALADLTRRSALVAVQPDVLAGEHSVAGLVPALAYYLPGTGLVPVAVRPDIRADEVRSLARALSHIVDRQTLVVVSVDFAHDLPPARTRAMDAESLEALERLDLRRAISFGDEHVDGRGALATGMAVADMLGARRFVSLGRTDGGELWGYAGGNVTSYISGYYTARP